MSGGDSYSRCSNPTRNELEQTVALLEGGKYGFSFSSGLAAVSTVFALLRAGDTAVVYALMKKQASGGGCVLSFALADDDVLPVLHGGKFIRFAESLGGMTSLITYPTTQTHASVPENVRLALGITPRLLRLSVGLEHPDDLLEGLEQMLTKRS